MSGVHRAVDRFLLSQRWLEWLADVLAGWIAAFYKALGAPGRGLKTFLNGTWLGHPLHPVLTDIPIGAWTLTVLFDLIYLVRPSTGPALGAYVALVVGILAALAAAATGYTEWTDTADRERRFGLAHGLLNSLVIVLFIISFFIHRQTSMPVGVFPLDLLGWAILVTAAYLGGDLVFNIGYGVNHHAFQAAVTEWTAALAENALGEGTLQRVYVQGTPILLYRRGTEICAISETCSHAGGPLSEGTVEGSVVQCPWHASRFDLCTGRVHGGPATMSQVRYDTRVVKGQVEIKRSDQTLQPN